MEIFPDEIAKIQKKLALVLKNWENKKLSKISFASNCFYGEASVTYNNPDKRFPPKDKKNAQTVKKFEKNFVEEKLALNFSEHVRYSFHNPTEKFCPNNGKVLAYKEFNNYNASTIKSLFSSNSSQGHEERSCDNPVERFPPEIAKFFSRNSKVNEKKL